VPGTAHGVSACAAHYLPVGKGGCQTGTQISRGDNDYGQREESSSSYGSGDDEGSYGSSDGGDSNDSSDNNSDYGN
jgi:hypothetical protein